MAEYIVSSGQVSSGIILNGMFDSMTVLYSGTANSTTVNAGGFLYVSSGGTANNTKIIGKQFLAAAMNILNEGFANNTTVNSSGYLYVSSGGTANNTTISSGGNLCVSSGGTATIVFNPWQGTVSSEDGAIVTYLEREANVYIGNNTSGIISKTNTISGQILDARTSAILYSGGIANSTTVNSVGRMWVSSGGTANSTTVNSNGYLYVSSTGTANSATINVGGRLEVTSGGTATEIIENGGYVDVQDGANVMFAPNTLSGLVLSYVAATVHSGTTANSTTVNKGGRLEVTSGGVANSTTVNSRGYLYVSSGGTATEIVENGGYVDVQDGANVMFAPNTLSGLVLSNAAATVHSGTTANSATVTGGDFHVSSGGTANSTTVNRAGRLEVTSGGVANNTKVNTDGRLTVSSGGTANNTTVNSDGRLEVTSGGIANNTKVNTDGRLTVSSGGLANKTTVSSGGYFYVSSGGTTDSATIYGNGELNVVDGGSAANARVYAGGMVKVSSGGTITGKMNFAMGAVISMEDGSIVDFDLMQAAPDGNALLSDWTLLQGTPDYTLTVDGTQAEGTYLLAENAEDFEETITVTNPPGETLGTLTVGQTAAIGVFNYSLNLANGVLSVTVEESKEITSRTKEVSAGQTSDGLIVSRNGYLYVHSGGTVNIVTVNDGGRLYISSGGTATGITENGGYVSVGQGAEVTFIPNEFSGQIVRKNTYTTVHSGTTATSATVNYGGYFRIYSGGTANNVTISSGGKIQVLSGGTATEITAAEGAVLYLTLAQGTCITGASAGSAFSFKDCFLSGYQVGTGWINVLSGGRAYDTTVNSGGSMFVKSLGQASDIAVRESGELHVSSGGVATLVRIENGAAAHVGISGTLNDITVAGSGSLEVLSGGMLTGRMTFAEGAGVSMEEGSVLNFNISGFNPSGTALVNDLSLITGEWTSTLTVSDAQINGKYMLANGAAGFNRTITVQNTSGDELGTLSVGQKAKIGDADYLLNLNDGKLSVTVSGGSLAPMVDHSFFPGCFAGGNQSLLAKQTDRNVTIYADGEVFGNGLVLDPGWEIAGVGDLNGDGRDDFLRVNDEGYVVGEMTKITGSFTPQVLNFLNEGWEILGTGDFNGNGFDDVLIANPTGASETVGLLGYWESGVTWTLINGYSPEWECIATGDFNADGKCDMLWRNSFEGEGGGTYNAYCTWIVDDPVDWRMVSVANPKEWAFLCSGDFDGDGANDIAMINDVGVVGIWGVSDGWLSSWSILSAVTPEWALAGVGDFNGDGTDDIAWCNAETGLVGAWIVKNKELNSWQTIAVVS